MTRTSIVQTRVPFGTAGIDVTVLARPAPRLKIHGLTGEAAEREARVRVECACGLLGLTPGAEVTVECPVPVTGIDLAIAVAALDAAGQLGARTMPEVYGELALDGRLRAVRGLYTAVRHGTRSGARIVPLASAEEAALTGRNCWQAQTLSDVVRWFAGAELPLVTPRTRDLLPLDYRVTKPPVALDWGDLGQDWRGTTELVLLVGEHGSGKTIQARWRASQLRVHDPRANGTVDEVLATRSVAGIFAADPVVGFRAPHHTVSDAGLVGGGWPRPRPGEVSLAHGGCLFLDEVAEFRRSALEALARALRDGQVRVTRPGCDVATFPARPQIVIGTSSAATKELARARALLRWDREIEVPRLTVAELLQVRS